MKKTNELNIKNKYGISLITLIITIIVMIILAMVVIVAISNRAEGARKARFYNDITSVQDAVDLKYMSYISKNIVEKKNEEIIPHLGKMTTDEKYYANVNIPTLNETVIRIKDDTLDNTNMYWLDVDNLDVSVKQENKYLIDMDTRKVYDYKGEKFEGRRWHVIDFGIKNNKNGKDPNGNNPQEDEAIEGWMWVYFTYPPKTINRQYMIKTGGEQGEWLPYPGKIYVRISDRNNIYYRYEYEDTGEVITVTPPGQPKLYIDFNPERSKEDVEKVEVTITYDSEAIKKQYRFDEGPWIDYTAPFIVTENCTIYARQDKLEEVLDENGNSLGITTTVSSKIKRVLNYIKEADDGKTSQTTNNSYKAPQLVRKNATTSSEVAKVEVKYPEVDGITRKVYKINLGLETEYTSEISILKYGTIVTAYYYVGEVKSEVGKIEITDTSAQTELDLSIYLNPETIYNANVVSSLVDIEYDRRADSKLYKLNTEEYKNYKSSFQVLDSSEVSAKAVETSTGRTKEISRIINFSHKPDITYFMTSTNSAEVIVEFSNLSTKNVYKIGDGEWIEYTGESNILRFKLEKSCYVYAKNTVNGIDRENSKHINVKVKESQIKAEPPKADEDEGTEICYEIEINHYLVNSNREAQVVIDYGENTGNEYKIGENGEWQQYSQPFTIQKNDVIYVKSANCEEFEYEVSNIDEMEIYATHTLIQDGTKAEVTINFNGDGNVKKYAINGANLVDYTGKFEVEENCYIYIYTEDTNALIVTDLTYTIGDILSDVPTISHVLKDSNLKADVTINYDEKATVKQYKIDNGIWLDYNGTFEIDKNCKITARNICENRNERISEAYNIIDISVLTPPVINITTDTDSATIDITYSPLSVANKYFISNSSGTTEYEYTQAFSVTESCYITATSVDKNGNTMTTTEEIKIGKNEDDEVENDEQVNVPLITSTSGNETSRVSIKYDKNAVVKKYSINGGTLQDYYQSFEVTENYTVIYAISYDKYGKPLDNTYTVTGIVKKLSVEVIPNTEEIAETVEITINYDSKATNKTYMIDGRQKIDYNGSFSINEKSTIKGIAEQYDNYGELIGYGEVIKKISNFPGGLMTPIIKSENKVSKSETSDGNIKIKNYYEISIEYDETAAKNYYQINEGTEVEYSEKFNIYMEDEEITIYAWSKDIYGNISKSDSITLKPDSVEGLILSKDKYYLMILNYPEEAINRRYKYGQSGVWKSYDENGFIFIPYEYQSEMIANGKVYVDLNGKIVDFTEHHYIIADTPDKCFGEIVVDYDVPNTKSTLQIKPLQTGQVAQVDVLLLYPNTISTVVYSLDDGVTWHDYDKKITVTVDNTKVMAKMRYSDGTWSNVVSKTINNIYVEPPTVTDIVVEELGSTSFKVIPQITVTDSEPAVYYYRITGTGAPNTSYVASLENNYKFTGLREGITYTVYVYVMNSSGNKSSVYSEKVKTVTLEEPVISGDATVSGWKYSPSNVTINYGSVPDTIREYSTDGVKWNQVSDASITLSVSSDMTLYARAKNIYGEEKLVSKKMTLFDSSDPVLNSVTLAEDGIRSTYVTFTVTSSDVGSGVGGYIYSTDDFATYKTCTLDASTGKITCYGLQKNITYVIKIKAVDGVGRKSKASAGITVYTEDPPVIDSWDGTVASGFARGTGTASDPYIIETAEQLAYFRQQVNVNKVNYSGKYIKLVNHIDLANRFWAPIGQGNVDGSSNATTYIFKGNFDGGNCKIYNMQQNVSDRKLFGFFGRGEECTIKNLTIESGQIVSQDSTSSIYCGAIIGYIKSGTIENCNNKIKIVGGSGNSGGIVGYVAGSESVSTSIKNCTNSGTIDGYGDSTGGIVGESIASLTISNCSNSGYIYATDSNSNWCNKIGGIVGYASQPTTISNSYNTGTIKGEDNIGGIIGSAADTMTVTECYNKGIVYANGDYAAGIIGKNTRKSVITKCYNEAKITADGSVAGINASSSTSYGLTITQCYNTGEVYSYTTHAGGINTNSGDANISYCYNTGYIHSYDSYAYGITRNSGIKYCYNTGKVASGDGDYTGALLQTLGTSYTYTKNYYLSGVASSAAYNKDDVSGKYEAKTETQFKAAATDSTSVVSLLNSAGTVYKIKARSKWRLSSVYMAIK